MTTCFGSGWFPDGQPLPPHDGPVSEWSPEEVYGTGVIVVYDGVVYYSVADSLGVEPGTDLDVWHVITAEDAVASVNGQTGAVVLDYTDVGAASAAQGALAYTAVQPDDLPDLAPVATSGAYSDLTGTPTIPSTPGDVGAATAAQGALADSAVQPSDLAPVATSGSYDDLGDTPIFAAVATSGQYGDLLNPPTIPSTPEAVGAAPAVHTHTQGQVDGLAAALAGKADSGAVVLLTGNQSIAGTKTFTNSVRHGADPVVANDLTRKAYVDAQVAGLVTVDTSVGKRVYVGGELLSADTGWRNVRGEIDSGTIPDPGNPVLLRREGDRVSLEFQGWAVDASGGNLLLDEMPIGFRPMRPVHQAGIHGASRSSRSWYIGPPGRVEVNNAAEAGETLGGRFGWITNDPWPSSLPGIPA